MNNNNTLKNITKLVLGLAIPVVIGAAGAFLGPEIANNIRNNAEGIWPDLRF